MNNLEIEISRLVNSAITRRLIDLHTALPGIVESFDPATGSADISIAIKRQKFDGVAEKIQVLPGVPVIYPRTQNFSFYFPLAKGDPVQLLFNERSLDSYKLAGGITEPSDAPRFFDYSDAVAIPSFWHAPSNLTRYTGNCENTAVFIEHAGGYLGIKADGKVYSGSKAGVTFEPAVLGNAMTSALDDMIARVDTLITKVSAALDAIKTGPVGVGNLGAPVSTAPGLVASLTTSAADLAAISASLAADKLKYVTTPATNIKSQTSFVGRV